MKVALVKSLIRFFCSLSLMPHSYQSLKGEYHDIAHVLVVTNVIIYEPIGSNVITKFSSLLILRTALLLSLGKYTLQEPFLFDEKERTLQKSCFKSLY